MAPKPLPVNDEPSGAVLTTTSYAGLDPRDRISEFRHHVDGALIARMR